MKQCMKHNTLSTKHCPLVHPLPRQFEFSLALQPQQTLSLDGRSDDEKIKNAKWFYKPTSSSCMEANGMDIGISM